MRIAAVGSSGRSTGPHVHYQVKAAGRTVNPADYIFE
jgi:murein DD-endopeptidase MepM/ murein hydrolase activator NlpD